MFLLILSIDCHSSIPICVQKCLVMSYANCTSIETIPLHPHACPLCKLEALSVKRVEYHWFSSWETWKTFVLQSDPPHFLWSGCLRKCTIQEDLPGSKSTMCWYMVEERVEFNYFNFVFFTGNRQFTYLQNKLHSFPWFIRCTVSDLTLG